MATKKFVKEIVESTSNDLQKKGLLVGGSLLAVTIIGDLIGGLRCNHTRHVVADSLERVDDALKRIEGVIVPPQPQAEEENEAAEGSENGPSKRGTK